MNTEKTNREKYFAFMLIVMGVFGLLVILWRLTCYQFEYDPKHYPVDYGAYNVLSYFTIQSNIFSSVYLVIKGFAVSGSGKAKKFAFNPTVTLFVTTYIIITGLVYCSGFPLKMSPPLHWNTAYRAMHSFTQMFHHVIMPLFMTVLFFFPSTEEKISKKAVFLAGIYPFVYSVFSIIRGAVGRMHFYAYPFYRPDFFTDLLMKGKEVSLPLSYILMLPALVLGIGLFIAAAAILRILYNRRINSKYGKEEK